MTRRKAAIALTVAVLCAGLLLVGCSSRKAFPGDSAAVDATSHPEGSRVELVLATMGSPNDPMGIDQIVQNSVSLFNGSQQEYHITVVDYNQGGETNTEEGKRAGLTQLYTEVGAGQYPDMLCFSSISPYPFIAKHLLLDMEQCIESDNTIRADDILSIQALWSMGGVYVLGSNVTVDSLIALRSRFGERYGWTLQEYLNMEAELDENSQMIYNVTRKRFLDETARRYTRICINWENGTCDFKNPDFISILTASSRVKETADSARDPLIGMPGTLLAEGKIVTSSFVSDQVYALAFDELYAGQPLSVLGWPTVDGSCGTELRFQHPIGIISKSEHIDGCWAFIKWLLTEEPVVYGLPLYRPRLVEAANTAMADSDLPVKMTNEQVAALFELLDRIEHIALYDDTVTEIVRDECSNYLDGSHTAEEAAEIIQAKVTIYLGELQ